MQIIEMRLSEIIPYENNPRKNDGAVDAVAASIREFGFKVPIIVDKDNVIVAGHTRLKAAEQLGLETVPVIRADDLTEEQVRAFRLADNKTNELAGWDFTALDLELENIFDIDMGQFGFELEDNKDFAEIVEDEIQKDVETRCKLGDIWQLGKHRLMCGDSTDSAVIDRLMDWVKADMVFTDPPYNMNYSGRGFINEQNKNVRQRIKDIIDFDPSRIKYLASGNYANNIFIFTSKDLIKDYISMFDGYAFNLLTWHKTNTPPMVNNNFFADTEYLLYFHRGRRVWNNGLKPIDKYKKYFISSIGQGKIDAEGEDLHPTMKPVHFISNEVEICSNENGVVLDPFGGSGSTLIACEQLNRKCYMMELDPHYCDVIIQRWENFTGEKAALLNV